MTTFRSHASLVHLLIKSKKNILSLATLQFQ